MSVHILSKKSRKYLLNDSPVVSTLAVAPPSFALNFIGNATQSYNGAKTVITFKGNGTLYATGSGNIEFLLVGGGGGGSGGGGGAGGLIYIPLYSLTSSAYPIVIGSGSAGTNGTTNSNIAGQNSTFALFTAYGGGHGARSDGGNTTQANGKNGGCGSGAGPSQYAFQSGGTASYSAQYNTGSNGGYVSNPGPTYYAGGGGGAGATGSAGLASGAGKGGDGLQFSINGTSSYYCGGGGGGAYNAATVASGGLGGGGGAGSLNGGANTGGGGAGNAPNTSVGGTGGSGVFIISY